MTLRMLVVAKAPVAGLVKTRLGADIGMDEAAEIAAAALVDSLIACAGAVGPAHCVLSLDGDLADAVRGAELTRLVEGWTVHPQVGDDFADRLVHAHSLMGQGLAEPGPVVQIGMDTPQVTPGLLLDAAAALTDQDPANDAVLGAAEDGGWWVLALRDPAAARALSGVPMSTPTTHDDTRQALLDSGLTVGATAILRDVDTVEDADLVAEVAPGSHFARAWTAARLTRGAPR